MSYSSKYIEINEYDLDEIGFENLFGNICKNFEFNINQLKLIKDKNKLIATPGKIELCFGADADWDLISRTLVSIADIDKNAQHEITVKMDYDEIEEHEKEGYVLVSYGKIKGDLYKVIFEIPFSNNSALKKLALSIYNSDEKTTKDVIWHGGENRIFNLQRKLSKLGWEINSLELIKDKKIIVEFSEDGLNPQKFKSKFIKSIEE